MLQKAFRITSFDVFPDGSVKPSALQRYMQQLAREDCDQCGCTYNAMRENNMVFVVTKLAIELVSPVMAGDVLVCRTYNDRIEGITFFREYVFKKNGEVVIRSTTQWVLVRYDTRALVRPKDIAFPLVEYRFGGPTLDIPRRIADEEKAHKVGEREVRLSDLDENDHLNNCVYSDIALDFIPPLADRKLTGLKIIFQHEARLHDVISVSLLENRGSFSVFAHNMTTDNPCFEAECAVSQI